MTEWGKPFTANGFGNKFKDRWRQADTSTALAGRGDGKAKKSRRLSTRPHRAITIQFTWAGSCSNRLT
jgi:hypothetical protein